MMGIFDSHAHYDDSRFSDDGFSLLEQLFTSGSVSGIVNVACDKKSCYTSKSLADAFPFVYYASGVHPHAASEWDDETEELIRTQLQEKKCVALGEIGLDYHYDFSPREKQKEVFERQLQIAKELDVPVILHSREACEDTLQLLRKYRPSGVMHCFSYSPEIAKEVCDLGLYVGLNGCVTFKNAKKPKASAVVIPEDRLLIETDCPYMAPEPHRGVRCDSSLLPFVVAELARLRQTDEALLIAQTEENAKRLFRIS